MRRSWFLRPPTALRLSRVGQGVLSSVWRQFLSRLSPNAMQRGNRKVFLPEDNLRSSFPSATLCHLSHISNRLYLASGNLLSTRYLPCPSQFARPLTGVFVPKLSRLVPRHSSWESSTLRQILSPTADSFSTPTPVSNTRSKCLTTAPTFSISAANRPGQTPSPSLQPKSRPASSPSSRRSFPPVPPPSFPSTRATPKQRASPSNRAPKSSTMLADTSGTPSCPPLAPNSPVARS